MEFFEIFITVIFLNIKLQTFGSDLLFGFKRKFNFLLLLT